MAETIKPLGVQPITIKKTTLWGRELEDRPGALAEVLEPFANAGVDLQVILRSPHPSEDGRVIVEVCLPSAQDTEKWRSLIQAAGLKASYVPALLVEGNHVPGLGYGVAQTIADLDIKIRFLAAQITGGKYIATIGFESDADAEKAAVSLLLVKLEAPGQENEPAAGKTS